jgi:hypothetical protein
MSHEIHFIKSFSIIGPYTLQITFENGNEQVIDFLPVLHGPMYGPLKDKNIFIKVTIDPEIKTLVWPNGADFDPAILYNWTDYSGDFIDLVSQQEIAFVREQNKGYGKTNQ